MFNPQSTELNKCYPFEVNKFLDGPFIPHKITDITPINRNQTNQQFHQGLPEWAATLALVRNQGGVPW